MNHIIMYESYVNQSGKVRLEQGIDVLNQQLKEGYVDQDYKFNVASEVFTWSSVQDNTKKDVFDQKIYTLKRIVPRSYALLTKDNKIQLFLELHFVIGKLLKRKKMVINLHNQSNITIRDLQDIHPISWPQHSLHSKIDFEKKETYPKTTIATSYTVADYSTYDKLKDLQMLLIDFEKDVNQ